ncbi:hypothetical protein pdam_00012805 [Pocillopora damicornis]|uniref:Uncharacterized protein n=1 Tax=Pocillopora damicornis TaxID=46731 RepID=A0A3M6T866_POCDA|nr:hypothetical protein pdam_00012805 [Pocillopora damicornis]
MFHSTNTLTIMNTQGSFPTSCTVTGRIKDAFLFHIPTKNPDFLQIVKRDDTPKGVGTKGNKDLLSWPEEHKEVKDPLKNHKYEIKFVGIDGEEVASKVKIEMKVWFDGAKLNK